MVRLVFSFDDNHQVDGTTGESKARLRQSGDLIDILPDGVFAGNDVESNTDRYFIIEFPGVDRSEFEHLLESGVDHAGPNRIRNISMSGLRDRLTLAGKARFDNERRLTMTRGDRRKIHDSTRNRN